MRRARAALAILLAGCGGDAVGDRQAAVINGTPTPAGAYPGTGALVIEFDGQYAVGCTGTLIAPDAVLTAAHCLNPIITGGNTPAFTLELDATSVGPSQIIAGASMHPHPMFDIDNEPTAIGRWYDIGVLLLAEPVPDAAVELLPTPEEAEALAAGTQVGLVGYGLRALGSDEYGVKYDGQATLVQVAEAELLISMPGEQQNCNGDSGGPAFIDLGGGPRLAGVVSRAPDDNLVCDHGGVDTRTDSYLEFIHGLVDIECGGLSGPCDCPDGDCEGGCGCRGTTGGAPGLVLILFAALVVVRRSAGARSLRSRPSVPTGRRGAR
jgi:V8-like Glu-specific endopeptidase